MDVLAHRLVLSYDAVADGVPAEHAVRRILQTVPLPQVASRQRAGGPGGFEGARRPTAGPEPARLRQLRSGADRGWAVRSGVSARHERRIGLADGRDAGRPRTRRPRPVAGSHRLGRVAAQARAHRAAPARRPVAGQLPGSRAGPRQRGRGVAAVRAGRRRAADGLAGDGAHDHAARPPDVADRELETWLVVDLSPSMDFGTGNTEKRELVLAAITAVTHLTVRGGNRVGAIVANGAHSYVDPRPGPDARTRGASSRASRPPRERRTGGTQRPGRMLEQLRRPQRRRGLVTVISDFMDGAAAIGSGPSRRRGNGRCARWPDATSCSRSRSSTRASWNCPRPGSSPSSTPRAVGTSRCRPPTRQVRSVTPRPPSSSAAGSPAALRHAGAAQLQLRTDRDWVSGRRPLRHRPPPVPGRRRRSRSPLMHFLAPAYLWLLLGVVALVADLRRHAGAPHEVRRALQQSSNCWAASRRGVRAGGGT